ncbi:MAG TPA: PLP-dependent aminotransferase family protein [Ktedonosporobacter sp.]|nr:PLP-dependent aminotransferase family protein [Ktedonosporobacter sp.]
MLQTSLSSHGHKVVLADWARTIQPSMLQRLLPIMTRPEVISFALGFPAIELFPLEKYRQALQSITLANSSTLQYGPASLQLKQHIRALMQQRGVTCREEQIFLTVGAQQGISLLTRLFLNPGGSVLAEEITYTGLLQIVAPYQPHILAVPTDSTSGIDLDALEAMLSADARPAFLYIVVDGHNPLGVSLSLEKRQRLVNLLNTYQVPAIEDDPYGLLFYEGTALPPLRALDDRFVYYIGSFSKILAPALRVGWIVVPESIMPQLSAAKEAMDLDCSTFAQHAIASFLADAPLTEHLIRLRQVYKERRDSMHQALQRAFTPEEARWCVPGNGLFIWVEFPEGINTSALLETALMQEQVAYVPGQSFSPIPDHSIATRSVRLSFSCTPSECIEEGIARLAQAIRRQRRSA